MDSAASLAFLIAGLVAPVLLFALLRRRATARGAAAIAIAAGWACNVAWAATMPAAPDTGDYLATAAMFGWLCPSLLVLVTWAVLRFAGRRAG